MNGGFSLGLTNRMFRTFSVAWVHLEYIAGCRRQDLNLKYAHVQEQREFTDAAYLVAAGHL